MHEAAATPAWVLLAYLISGVCFILALRGLSNPESSRRGNRAGMIGMAIAVVTTLLIHPPVSTIYSDLLPRPGEAPRIWHQELDLTTLLEILGAMVIGGGIGLVTARKIQMTAMPQLVAAFHSLVGMAAVLVGAAAFLNPEAFGIAIRITPIATPSFMSIYPVSRIEMGLGVAIGAITFSGSVIAFLKLNGNMSGKPILLPLRHVINLATLAAILLLIAYFTQNQDPWVFFTIMGLSFAIGFLLIIPIGGADMPVVISMLNSYSGWAAAAMGFTLHNSAMIITGALVGSSGAILSYIMCRAMNRSFISVIAGGFGTDSGGGGDAAAIDRPWKRGSAEDAAFLMKQADQVIIVPGYGMAVSQAQHALKEMADKLKEEGVRVKYAIHPVAGRMPGHMNVLLAEANVPYDEVFELEDINSEFAQTDVAFVIGANDVTNPAAKTDRSSPIYGMPVLDVEKARTVLFVKRSMGGVGYAGVDNELFYRDSTMMLLSDAKKMVEEIVKSLG
ncbi:NAD(P)(+) transhydrogenase (Re/Si-specific) subunit beta [Sphingomonas sp. RG327]|uniref:NAD(P) transhydrogenase subunit beta n=1 Tax=Sphingomonas anseongensis TaxID=2908207 RepID=A0ABT0RDA9_9SPHN|nr:NAD(P)(+) transhydrogenase (Re/Si-specific) subunit beta [Sphingomonas anseongensis]MCL6678250.1 NAD(P)(+) transhydrogenase (Re/Si-specific) subunit beta [Sphingomonas anseongensis]